MSETSQELQAQAFSNRGIETAETETLRAASHGALPMVALTRGIAQPELPAAEQLTFWSVEHLVRISQSPDCEREWMGRVVNSPLGTDFDCDGGLITAYRMTSFGEYDDDGTGSAMKSRDYKDAIDLVVTHFLRGVGFDGSEDGTGRGTPIVPTLLANGDANSGFRDEGGLIVAIQGAATRENPDSGPDGVGVRTDGQAFTLEARSEVQMVMTLAMRGRDGGQNLEAREDGIANAILTPNGGRGGIGVGAIAFAQNTRDEAREMVYTGALSAQPGTKQQSYIRQAMAVRRLTPRECERLQGFPDDYTRINSKTPDGARYKALGNSMAVPVMRWIGERIQAVEDVAGRAGR